MNEPVIAKLTKQTIVDLIANPSHAVLIVGNRGTGKLTIAKHIATKVLGTGNIDKLSQNPYFMVVKSGDKNISIDIIRELKAFFKLKTTGNGGIRRVVVVENADLMTDEAQNAILKILEEPPSDLMIILTSKSDQQLNKTIISRVQLIRLYRPNINEVMAHFKAQSYGEEEINLAYNLSNGSVGLMTDLLDKDARSEIFQYVEDAKKILSSTRLEKLLAIEMLSSDRNELVDRQYAIKRVCSAGLNQAVNKGQTKLIAQWLKILREIEKAEKAIERGGNIKLLLTDLLVNL